MKGTMSEERAVKVSASEAWKLYSSLDLAKFVEEALPHLISSIHFVQGNGEAGTIIQINFAPGIEGGMKSYKEKFVVVDHEKRVKVAEVVEGGYLDLGFTLYRVTFAMIQVEGKENECITKTTVDYELKEEAAANAAFVTIQPLSAIMKASADYLERNTNTIN